MKAVELALLDLVPVPGPDGWDLEVPLPDTPALLGLRLALQSAVFPTPAPRGFDLSRGAFVTLGR